jgi:hypothetical protein
VTISLTTWNRLEPRPRINSVVRQLAAEVRDPLWMLTRQWQFGEFIGEDGGSIAWTSITTQVDGDAFWSNGNATGNPTRPLLASTTLPARPLEEVFEREDSSDPDDLTLGVELGQLFEEILEGVLGAAFGDHVGRLRAVYPLPRVSDESGVSEEVRRFAEYFSGRTCNGWRVREDSDLVLLSNVLPGVSTELRSRIAERFRAAVVEVIGEELLPEERTWRSASLRYAGNLSSGPSAESPRVRLSVSPGLNGEIDWYAFDTLSRPGSGPTETRYVLPGYVRFRGMPNARFWDFERAESDPGAVSVDTRGLGRLLLVEFMLIQGNDWFTIPLPMPIGSVCQVTSLCVRNVFDEDTNVPPVERLHEGWTMFSATRREPVTIGESWEGGCGPRVSEGVDRLLHLPASASMSMQVGPTVEEIRLQRDEMANVAWAIERVIPDPLGRPRPARELAELRLPRAPPSPPARDAGATERATAGRYVLESAPPAWWYPLVPVRAGTGTASTVALQAGHVFSAGPPVASGRMIHELQEASGNNSIREEELTRSGLNLIRSHRMSRWIDGSIRRWCQRTRTTGSSEGSSGLGFDRLEAER